MARARARNFALTSCPISSLSDHNNSLKLSRPARSLPKPPFCRDFPIPTTHLDTSSVPRFFDSYHKPLSQACTIVTLVPPHHPYTQPTTISHSSIRYSYIARAHYHVRAPSHRPRAFPLLSNQRDLRHHGQQHHPEPAWLTHTLGPRVHLSHARKHLFAPRFAHRHLFPDSHIGHQVHKFAGVRSQAEAGCCC